MGKLISIGEMLIDFTAAHPGKIDEVMCFEKNPGGAPANVALCTAKYGAEAIFWGKLGTDAFGDYLLEILRKGGVDASYVKRTEDANTPLAFVALDSSGEREFVFYRNPSSDLLLSPEEIDPAVFSQGDILHFCSVSLVDYPVKYAHKAAISYALDVGALISFDPNLRYSLWPSREKLIETVREFIPYAHILKLGEDELKDVSGIDDEADAVRSLFMGNVGIVLITRGQNGASAYFKNMARVDAPGVEAVSVDATGAGDTFIGTFLYQVLRSGKGLEAIADVCAGYLRYCNRAAGLCVSRRGAIPALPSYKEVFYD